MAKKYLKTILLKHQQNLLSTKPWFGLSWTWNLKDSPRWANETVNNSLVGGLKLTDSEINVCASLFHPFDMFLLTFPNSALHPADIDWQKGCSMHVPAWRWGIMRLQWVEIDWTSERRAGVGKCHGEEKSFLIIRLDEFSTPLKSNSSADRYWELPSWI